MVAVHAWPSDISQEDCLVGVRTAVLGLDLCLLVMCTTKANLVECGAVLDCGRLGALYGSRPG